jgi:integrase
VACALPAAFYVGLLLYTGQRRSDVVNIGRQHVHNGVLTIDQGKTDGVEEAHLEIPVHPKLREIIDATPTIGVKTFLVTHFGKPYTAPGFGNWFRGQCDAADCPDVSAMGCASHCAETCRDRLHGTSGRSHHRPRQLE